MKKFLPLFFSAITLIVSSHVSAQGGTLPLNGSVSSKIISSAPDIWTVTTMADGLLQLKLTGVSPADLLVTLLDETGTTIIAGPQESFNGTTATINADGLAPGTYHVRISSFAINAGFGSYTLSDSFIPAALPNDAEPNGSPATAIDLPLNTGKTGHLGYYHNNQRDTADWYKVTINGDGLLQLNLSMIRGSAISTNTLDVTVVLFDHDATTQLGSVEVFNGNGPGSNLITTDGLAAGTYYIRVQPFSTAEFANYTLTGNFTPAALASDVEPNGTAATAQNLPLNTATTGHLGYYYNHQRDTADWYQVTINGDGLLQLNLSMIRGSAISTNTLDVTVVLFDHDATTQLGSVEVFNGNGPGSNLITTDGLAAGTYYIRVQPFSTTEFANYTLTGNFTPAALANDAEPNASPATAVNLPLNSSATGHLGYYYNHQRDTADWYKVTTTGDGLLRVYLSMVRGSALSSNTLDVEVLLYDNNATTQLASVEVFNGNGPGSNLITADGLAAGTYYIKVQPFSTAEFANYTITDSLFSPPLATDAEPDGNTATALTLPLNTSMTGHVGYYYDNRRDSADWYKITTTTQGLFRVFLSTARGSVYSNNTLDVNLWLYAADGITQLASREVFNGNGPGTDFIRVNSLPAGTYFIKIQPFSSIQFADYTLTDSSFSPSTPLVASSTVTNPRCNGLTGSASFSASGGAPPYSYYLTSATSGVTQHNSTGAFTGLTAGVYLDSIVDAGKQTVKGSITIAQPAPVTVADIQGAAQVSKGSSIPLTDPTPGGIWSSSDPSIAAITPAGIVTGIANGQCKILYSVSNASGCSAAAEKELTVFGHPSAKASAGEILCHGGQTTLTVDVTGGSGSYSYSLNGGAFQTSNIFTVSAGIYLAFVKDNNSHQFAFAASIVDQPLPLALKIISRTDAGHGQANGSFTVTGWGGSAPYWYSIDHGSSYQPSGVFSNLSPGAYPVSVKDDHGCIALDQTTIHINDHGHKGGKGENDSFQAIVFPNPSSSFFTLELISGTEQPVEIQVFDIHGRIVWQTHGEAPNTYRFGNNFCSGMYLLKIMTKEGTEVIKLIKD
jgi:Secretion system C-terminal sorting domain/SprB repeat